MSETRLQGIIREDTHYMDGEPVHCDWCDAVGTWWYYSGLDSGTGCSCDDHKEFLEARYETTATIEGFECYDDPPLPPMSLLPVNTRRVTDVLLADGWHEVDRCSLAVIPFAFEVVGQYGTGMTGPLGTGLGYAFLEKGVSDYETQIRNVGPLTAILAVREVDRGWPVHDGEDHP